MAISVFSTMDAFVTSFAVHSMKMFSVVSSMRLALPIVPLQHFHLPLIRGGSESTVPLLSHTTGTTGES